MQFNSLPFVVFFLVVLGLYRVLRGSYRAQNGLVLAASYVFYGYWDWRFLGLIAFTTLLDFSAGLGMARTEDPRRRQGWLLASIAGNLAVLAFFKYFNFFTESFAGMLELFGMRADALTLKIVLPVGISFYIFQSLSYTIDVYKKRMDATGSLLNYAAFVAMFPQLLSGPIARAKAMLPQLAAPRTVTAEQVNTALFLLLWGYFKKVVIADNLAQTTNLIFDNYTQYHGLDLLVAVLSFAVQIYCDFSGYSDMARGIAKLLGFELPLNFRLPYFALHPADFWSRWNISLSTWLRDYLYWPLMATKPWKVPGGRGLEVHAYRNMLLTMLLGGLWHGASWNFVLWGGYYGVLLILFRLIEPEPSGKNPWRQERAALRIIPRMALMFVLTLGGWLLFRAESVGQIGYFLTNLSLVPTDKTLGLLPDLLFFSAPLVLMQLWQYRSGNLLIPTGLPVARRVALYSLILFGIFAFGVREHTEFIYFNF